MRQGHAALAQYLESAGPMPLRDYVGYIEGREDITRECCKDHLVRSEPDDDINYSTLALLMLEQHGPDLKTIDVARAWLKFLPAGSTYTAERAAYKILLSQGSEWFAEGAEPGFELEQCSDNPYNDWIGAQIRADLYGWVCPGQPGKAAALAQQDAALSHRGDGVYGAMLVAALGAALATQSPESALKLALQEIPAESGAAEAVRLGLGLVGDAEGGSKIRAFYPDLSPVHTNNNLALVIWALFSHLDDFSAAIGEVVMAGLDTDCNGATVGALWGLQGEAIPEHWLAPWENRVGLSLAGYDELTLDELVQRTVALVDRLQE